MRLLVNRYLQLLELVAQEPEQPIGDLQRMVVPPKPLRWIGTNYAWAIYDFYKLHVEPRFASSALLRRFWRVIREGV
jgi:hypothetical protein